LIFHVRIPSVLNPGPHIASNPSQRSGELPEKVNKCSKSGLLIVDVISPSVLKPVPKLGPPLGKPLAKTFKESYNFIPVLVD